MKPVNLSSVSIPGEGPLPLPDAAKYGETVFIIGQAGERRLEGQSAVIRRIR